MAGSSSLAGHPIKVKRSPLSRQADLPRTTPYKYSRLRPEAVAPDWTPERRASTGTAERSSPAYAGSHGCPTFVAGATTAE